MARGKVTCGHGKRTEAYRKLTGSSNTNMLVWEHPTDRGHTSMEHVTWTCQRDRRGTFLLFLVDGLDGADAVGFFLVLFRFFLAFPPKLLALRAKKPRPARGELGSN